ncbi:3-hydroxyacyl-CoA dehydrogenase [Candidatus Marsarchaeota G2 archaeon ECH_B_SAG-G16]|uniref:3-hydroxyacyl-CoA dehydrogenase n=3 Tax=Candidatus Marsarchaeota TaxID=1978152 RepID=A0A2R6A849_9ARCH|nr:MAG: 3-hydroxyacyl-CoA dehydrogenase [Candidatus Marsarchaeota G1 archaeon OSP_D]PSN88825.1 MAG: 3-hydroxyacyl-CoA dehydrogenase [Candidatus Marsarchaeota G1 archaeon OSP_C]PSO04583.1 MAG: 3-hydroxyacyl-CoA dehydrogenase [Candidatus Marsarchaeota G2 archaeon ECH_B_SAG-G16]
MEIKSVAVLGAGEMGHGIAQVFAQAGFDVRLMDKYPEALERAKQRIQESLTKLSERGRIKKEEAQIAYARIVFTQSVEQAVSGVQLVIEAVPEKLEIKSAVLKHADKFAPKDAVFASNTSNIRITTLARVTSRAERFVGLHFFNPPVIMKLVEVTPAETTDPSIVDEMVELCKKIGKTPVRLKKDSPGFIVNRINAADMLFFCLVLDKGVAKPEEVDSYIRSQGLPMGPYELLDFVGLDIAHDSLLYLSQELSEDYSKCKTIKELYEKGALGKKSGRGFYDWSSGKPSIPSAKPTDKLTLLDIFAIEINEAVKLIEEGVATPEDIETAVKLGMNRPFGPISVAKSFTSLEVRQKLEELSQKFECKVFYPTRSIREGKLREVIEGRVEGAQKSSQKVYVEKKGKVAKLLINKPPLNTIDSEVLDALEKSLEELSHDKEIRVLLVTGAGDTFSAGAELSQFFRNSVEFSSFARKGERVFRRLSELPFLTVAFVKKYALGGALELALWCDLRLATPESQMGFPEVTLGLIPAWSGTQRLARLIGVSRASELILTGKRISAKQAYEWGLVNALVEDEASVIKFAEELAQKLAPISVMLAKTLLNKGTEAPSDIGLELEAMAAGLLFSTEDLKEGISAFLQKRQPEFRGV